MEEVGLWLGFEGWAESRALQGGAQDQDQKVAWLWKAECMGDEGIMGSKAREECQARFREAGVGGTLKDRKRVYI